MRKKKEGNNTKKKKLTPDKLHCVCLFCYRFAVPHRVWVFWIHDHDRARLTHSCVSFKMLTIPFMSNFFRFHFSYFKIWISATVWSSHRCTCRLVCHINKLRSVVLKNFLWISAIHFLEVANGPKTKCFGEMFWAKEYELCQKHSLEPPNSIFTFW